MVDRRLYFRGANILLYVGSSIVILRRQQDGDEAAYGEEAARWRGGSKMVRGQQIERRQKDGEESAYGEEVA